MKIQVTIFIMMLFCCDAAAQTQTINLKGHVKDGFTHADVVGVKVSLLASDSTVMVDSLPSLPTGYGTMYVAHALPRKPLSYIIRAVHPDYETTFMGYTMKENLGRLKRVELPDLMMKKVWKKELGEVEVKATRIKMVMRGDTIVYDASAFDLPSGSMLDALVRQLPGAELKSSGEIFINGRKVDYLMLNSREFFRGNNRVMLDNLPYYTVKDIKVYERNTDLNNFLGREVEDKEFVMDVNLKREYQKGYLGHVDAGGGTGEHYAAKLFALGFTDRARVTLFANVNNVNQTREPGADSRAAQWGAPQDVTTTQYAGGEFFREGRDKSWQETFKATARWSHTETGRSTQRQDFLSGGGENYGRSLLDRSARNMHLYADQNFFKYWKRWYVWNRTKFEYDKRKDKAFTEDLTSVGEEMDSDTVGYSRAESRADGHTVDLFTWGSVTPKLPWGDYMSVHALFNYVSSRNKDYSKAHVRSGAGSDYRHDHGDLGRDAYTVRGIVQYRIPTLRGFTVNFDYQPKYEHYRSHDRVYRLDRLEGWDASGDMPLLVLPSVADMMRYCTDTQNTHDYARRSQVHSLKVSFDYSRGFDKGWFWTNILLPVEITGERAEYSQGGEDFRLQRTKTLFRPKWDFRFDWREGMSRADMSVELDASLPDLQLMFPYTYNRDALHVKEGNAHLKTTYVYKWRGGFEHKVKRYGQMLRTQLHANIYRNQLANGQWYDPETGVYIYRPVNVNGNWDAGVEAHYTITFGKERNMTFQDKLTGRFLHSVDVSAATDHVGSSLSKVDTYEWGKNLSFGYALGTLNFRASSGLTWRIAGARDISAIDWNCGFEGTYTIPRWKTSLQSNLTVYGRSGYGVTQYDGSDFVWNLAVSQPFAKDKLVARVECYDLLHRMSSTQYNINAQGRSVTTYRCLPNYVMFHLVYHWNRNPKKQ